MAPFGYRRPESLEAALAALRCLPQARLLAGGQSLLSAMKLGLDAPSDLIDLRAIPSLHELRVHDGRIHLGAMVEHHRVARSADIVGELPGLSALAAGIGDAQIRRRGTIGGSLANNDPAACWPAALLALNARVQTDRRVIAADAFVGPLFSTALMEDEIITSVSFPARVPFVYLKVEQPASRFALIGLAMARLPEGVRVAVTGVADRAMRLPAMEAALDRQFEPSAVPGSLLEAHAFTTDLHAGADYRRHLCVHLARRAVAGLGR